MYERLSRILHHPAFIPVTVGIVSFGAGTGFGYILKRRNKSFGVHEVPEQLELNYDAEAMEAYIEREEAKRGIVYIKPEANINNITDKGKSFVSELIPEIDTDDISESITTVDDQPVTRSIFSETDDEWDYDEELATRTTMYPYVIHKDEFYADEKNYHQITLTYYAGDNIMVDEDDTPIYNHDLTVGELAFGHGSGDPNVFHVRNDKNKAEYEIIRDPGLYSIEVLGLQIENNERAEHVKHSANRKFRME